MASELIGYFGFGSLVNRETLRTSYVDTIPARLHGWQRHWQGRQAVGDQSVVLLSIHGHAKTHIDGMLVIDRIENLDAVDRREVGYDRVTLTTDDLEFLSDRKNGQIPDRLFVYVGKPPMVKDSDAPLLQSYTDAVMQGYLNEFGENGLRRFMITTKAFERRIILDRHNPRYPRAVALSRAQSGLFDQLLAEAGVSFEDQSP